MIFHQIWIRIRRKPWLCAVIFLFVVVMSLALCSLSHGTDAALAEYETVCAQVPIRCTVTNLTGNQSDNLKIYHGILGLFTGSFEDTPEHIPAIFADLLEDIQVKGSVQFSYDGKMYTLTGITSIEIDTRLRPENQCTIFWNEGEDESLFSTEKEACIIPQSLVKKLEAENLPTDSFPISLEPQNEYQTEYTGDLPVAGVYSDTDESKVIYCPWATYVRILRSMNRYEKAEAIHGTLRNNKDLELLREVMAPYFVEPNSRYAGMYEVDGRGFALDINDAALVRAKNNLENSMAVNRAATVLVFVLATAAGAFVGFLVIRNRKREIALMRTLGTSNGRIYANFALEQMLFVILGTIAGGAKFMWTPALWLILFVCVYYVGLSVAIVVTLRKNLLASIKENE